MKLTGADICVKMPGLDTSATTMKFGLEIFMKAFDKTTVDLNSFWIYFPLPGTTLRKSFRVV